jgi:hypothetical protein
MEGSLGRGRLWTLTGAILPQTSGAGSGAGERKVGKEKTSVELYFVVAIDY